mmetsp:Transcript_11322/g.32141  ORF Transcript_11322/g.32141 Transcript_11322/m.32141 type:complete len:252 (+) Transcript_11322:75-830(+)
MGQDNFSLVHNTAVQGSSQVQAFPFRSRDNALVFAKAIHEGLEVGVLSIAAFDHLDAPANHGKGLGIDDCAGLANNPLTTSEPFVENLQAVGEEGAASLLDFAEIVLLRASGVLLGVKVETRRFLQFSGQECRPLQELGLGERIVVAEQVFAAGTTRYVLKDRHVLGDNLAVWEDESGHRHQAVRCLDSLDVSVRVAQLQRQARPVRHDVRPHGRRAALEEQPARPAILRRHGCRPCTLGARASLKSRICH